MKISLQVIILTAISLALVSPLCSSVEFSFNIPSQMESDSEVPVSVSISDSDVYDIKIFFDDEGTELSGEIYADSNWKNSRYYLQDIDFKDAEFRVRLKDPDSAPDQLNVCVRVRAASSTSTPEKQCLSIEVNEKSLEPVVKKEPKPDMDVEVHNEVTISKEKNTTKPEPIVAKTASESKEGEEPIYLASEAAKETQYTSLGKSRILINYFIALAVIIGIFLIIRSESKHREI